MTQQNYNDKYLVIPPNYQTGFNILGFVVKKANFFQGILMGSVLLLMFFLLFVINRPWTSKYVTGFIIVFFAGFGPGVAGVRGGTFWQYISNILKFRANKRVAVYNGRIKLELKRLNYEKHVENALVPKDQIILFWNRFKNRGLEAEQQKVSSQVEAFRAYQDYYFEDDEGVVAKPEEYMTRKERRQFRKKQKKERRLNGKKQKED